MSTQTYQQIEVSPGQLVERLVQYDGPPEQFLLQLLAVQCRVGNAECGAILRAVGGEEAAAQMEVLSIYPPLEAGAAAPLWLSQAVELAPKVISTRRSQVVPARAADEMYGVSATRYLVLLPIWGKTGVRGVAAFIVPNSGPTDVEQSHKRLELTITLLSLYELRLTLQRRKTDLQRLRQALEVLNAVNEQARFRGAAMALCNHIAAAFQAERVGVGLLRGRYVKLQGLSHTEKFTRKMEAVQVVESAMEECLDQDSEVVYPAGEGAAIVNRAAKELSQRHGMCNVLLLPMRRGGEPVGVLSVERPADRPFAIEDVETLRVTCDLCTARLVELAARDRWFGAKAAAGMRKGLSVMVGPRHTWAKIAVIAVIGVLLFATLVPGTYRVEAPFIVEAHQRQIIAAPFDGYLIKVHVRPGDEVQANQTILAELDAAELRLERNAAAAQHAKYETESRAKQEQGKREEAQMAAVAAEEVAAKIELLDWQISKAPITSPISGRVMAGDLTKEQGVAVEKGKTLFEVAPRELHAELTVPEDQIADVEVGDEGQLAALAHPGRYIKFVVDRIDPVAEVDEQRNVFRVRVRLTESPAWMRPGMEGVAKVDADRRSYGYIWTRELVNWVRMKLWI